MLKLISTIEIAWADVGLNRSSSFVVNGEAVTERIENG